MEWNVWSSKGTERRGLAVKVHKCLAIFQVTILFLVIEQSAIELFSHDFPCFIQAPFTSCQESTAHSFRDFSPAQPLKQRQ